MSHFESKDFVSQLEELPKISFATKILRGSMSLEQTKRNEVRRELLEGLKNFFEKIFDEKYIPVGVYETKEGVAIEIEHPDAINSGAGEGFITLLLDLSIQSLEYNAMEANELWEEDKAIAAEKAKIRAEEAKIKAEKAEAKAKAKQKN